MRKYSYDKLDNIIKIDDRNWGEIEYSYSNLGQIAKETHRKKSHESYAIVTQTFEYDSEQNLVSTKEVKQDKEDPIKQAAFLPITMKDIIMIKQAV